MNRPDFDLSTITSDGPKTVQAGEGVTAIKATPCGRCGETIAKGERIAKTFAGWQHRQCSVETLARIPASRAWLALAMDAARRPRDYKTAQLRQILTAVIGIAFGADTDEHDAYVEALTFAYEKRVEDALGERVGTLDPDAFARRWADFDWFDSDTDQRLPLDDAYRLAWADGVDGAA